MGFVEPNTLLVKPSPGAIPYFRGPKEILRINADCIFWLNLCCIL